MLWRDWLTSQSLHRVVRRRVSVSHLPHSVALDTPSVLLEVLLQLCPQHEELAEPHGGVTSRAGTPQGPGRKCSEPFRVGLL